VLEKLGFVREGMLRENCIVNGDVSDSWVYGLLRRQWKPRLAPSVAEQATRDAERLMKLSRTQRPGQC
jgi:hypothetical protein